MSHCERTIHETDKASYIELEARIVDKATPALNELGSEWDQIPEVIAAAVLCNLVVEAREMGLGDVTLFELGEASGLWEVPSGR